ncbi:MAG: hypothetical protein DME97_02430 [Verrucomicrobia bacterium]|nr:MAG: hypothetical protein DME97_02430 [Verrucomicrobiota bacterium]
MEDIRQAVAKRSPILFCFALVTPVILMLVAVRISAQFGDPPGVGYTAAGIILCSALSAVILTCGLSIWGWTRGEHPRLLAFVGPLISIWLVWRLFFV